MNKRLKTGVSYGSYTASMVVVCHCTDNYKSVGTPYDPNGGETNQDKTF